MPGKEEFKENEVQIINKDTDDDKEVNIEVVLEDAGDHAPEPKEQKENKEEKSETTEEDLDSYGASVRKRIKELTQQKYNAQREKEETARERDEAVQLAKSLLAEKNYLEQRFSQGEEMFIGQAKEKVDLSIDQAKRAYKDAYEAGDGDKMADAQEALARAAVEKERVTSWRPTKPKQTQENTLQNQPASVYNQPQRAAPDPEAVEWAKKNTWFGNEDEMTAMAYGVHDRLMKEGITPASDPDKYYSTIEKRVREKFPEYEWPEATREQNKSATVVAAVNRSPKSIRVTLNKSQVALAKRLGLTNEQYAKEIEKLETI
jgi:hypothetical protein